ncbi:hypothetical protein OIV83_002565 [Microbotryomycetes sp. JL201]|nr:hypothetical protein OIV83_002565 [Microbotryomycetes sp. JL201]
MSETGRQPSIFGTDDDPRRDSALRPWQWLPLTFIVVAAILFVSLRRSQALEIYRTTREANSRYASLPANSIRGGVRETSDLAEGEEGAYTDSDLDPTSPSAGDRFTRSPFDEDEFPRTAYISPAKRLADASEKVKDGVQTVMKTLGWDGRAHTAFRDGRDDGIARAFWGVRPMRRAGMIRLNDESGPEDMLRPRTPSNGDNTERTLFDEEADEATPRELPSDFRLHS